MRVQKNKGISRMEKLFIVLILGISLVYLPVAAQEDSAPAPASPKLKSEALAFSLSLFGTLIPLSIGLFGVRLAFLGCLIGPSLGYFYAGLWGRALLGIGIRTLAGAAIFSGAAMGFTGILAGIWAGSQKEAKKAATVGSLLALGGVILFAGSGLWDIFSVKSAVRDHNQLLQEKKLSLAPFYIPSSKTIGIQVHFSF
jgi:hypothetical protein